MKAAIHAAHRAQRIILVGYRASGKSTVARALGQRLQWPWVDLDAVIEQMAQASIPEIFAGQGEDAFREWESRCLGLVLAEAPPQVIATGGGVVEREHNRHLLHQSDSAWVCYLAAPAAVLQQRLREHCGNRPSLAGGQHPADELPPILARRDPWYRQVAHYVADAQPSQSQVVGDILAAYQAFTAPDA